MVWVGSLGKGRIPRLGVQLFHHLGPGVNSVDALDIGWGSGPVEIRAGQGAVITVTEYASRPLEEAEQLAVSSSGGVLKIRWDGSIVPLGLLQDWEKRLVVEVPQAVASQLEEFECRNFSGDVAVSGFWAQDIQVASASGDVSIFYLDGETAKVSTVSGNVCWQGGNVSQLRVESTSGAVDLTGMTSQVCSLETASGPVHYQGEGKEFSVETVSAPMWAGLSSCPEEADCAPPRGPSPFPCRRTMALRRSTPAFPVSFPPSSPARKRIKRSAIKRGAPSFLLPPPRGTYRSKSSETARGSKTKGALYVRRNFRGHCRFPV